MGYFAAISRTSCFKFAFVFSFSSTSFCPRDNPNGTFPLPSVIPTTIT